EVSESGWQKSGCVVTALFYLCEEGGRCKKRGERKRKRQSERQRSIRSIERFRVHEEYKFGVESGAGVDFKISEQHGLSQFGVQYLYSNEPLAGSESADGKTRQRGSERQGVALFFRFDLQ